MAKEAYFISDRSGFRFKYSERVKEPGTGYIVGPNESDGEYNLVTRPLNKAPKISPRRPLRDARPPNDKQITSALTNINTTRAALGLPEIEGNDGWVPSDTIVT